VRSRELEKYVQDIGTIDYDDRNVKSDTAKTSCTCGCCN